MKNVGVNAFQIIPTHVIIAITGCGGKTDSGNFILLHSGKDFCLIVLSDFVNCGKAVLQLFNGLLAVFVYFFRNAHFGI